MNRTDNPPPLKLSRRELLAAAPATAPALAAGPTISLRCRSPAEQFQTPQDCRPRHRVPPQLARRSDPRSLSGRLRLGRRGTIARRSIWCRSTSISFPRAILSRERAARFPQLKIYPTIAEALCAGRRQAGRRRRADHRRARQLPASTRRARRSIRATSSSSRRSRSSATSGRSVPVFNDKHLSWNWDQGQRDGRHGSRAWASRSWPARRCRSPGGCRRSTCRSAPRSKRLSGVGYGGVDSYDFHALEAIQCMVERRSGGETGRGARAGPARRRGLAGAWSAATGTAAAGTRHCSRPACAAATTRTRRAKASTTSIPRPTTCAGWSQDPWPIASNTPTA